MSYNDDQDKAFVCSKVFCCFRLKNNGKQIGVYLAGILFALGWWAFVDGLTFLWHLEDRKIAPGIEDWAPGIVTTLGMIIVNLIDKETLKGDGYYEERHVWVARLFLFLGFSMMAGGLSGSVAVLVTKYIYNEALDIMNTYLGITDVVQNTLIMSSAAVLWLAQSSSFSEQQYYRI